MTTDAAVVSEHRSLAGSAVRLVAAWTLVLGAVVAVGWLITHPLETTVEPRDDELSRWFADQRTGALGTPADVGTLLGDTLPAMALLAAIAIGLAAWRRTWQPLVFAGLLAAGMGGFYAVATRLVPRDRPPVEILDPGLVPDASFPSGHVGTATVVYGGVLLLARAYAPAAGRWLRVLLAVPVIVLLARLYEGAHHLTDVLTSLTYGVVWLAVVQALALRGHDSAS